jgi:hypothetical protein
MDLNKKQFAELKAKCDEYASERVKKDQERAMRQWFKLLAVALNESFGFGEKRTKKLMLEIVELIRIHDDEDIEFWTHIDRRCQQIGVLEILEGNKV